jgi:2TM domain
VSEHGPTLDEKRRRRIAAFRRHLAIYLAATVVLLLLNLTLAPMNPLTIFPLFAWGIVVALHAARVMGLLGR